MRWTDRRLLFGPPVHLDWAASHAMTPVADPREDGGMRIYFTTRDPDGRSHVARAELDPGARWDEIEIHPEPVLRPGPLGTFDDSGTMVSSVVSHGGARYLYYIGWTRGVTVPFYVFVGCAVSEDGGLTYERASPAPVMDRGPADPILTTSPWVTVESGRWRMWYTSGTRWELEGGRPKHHYRICYAESDDGLEWRRSGHVCIDYRPGVYAIAKPCVIKDGELYRMWYCYRGESYRIGYAESGDGLSWTLRDEEAGIDVSESGWDSEMIEYPCVFDFGGERHLLYNGNGYGSTGVGLATLQDGP